MPRELRAVATPPLSFLPAAKQPRLRLNLWPALLRALPPPRFGSVAAARCAAARTAIAMRRLVPLSVPPPPEQPLPPASVRPLPQRRLPPPVVQPLPGALRLPACGLFRRGELPVPSRERLPPPWRAPPQSPRASSAAASSASTRAASSAAASSRLEFSADLLRRGELRLPARCASSARPLRLESCGRFGRRPLRLVARPPPRAPPRAAASSAAARSAFQRAGLPPAAARFRLGRAGFLRRGPLRLALAGFLRRGGAPPAGVRTWPRAAPPPSARASRPPAAGLVVRPSSAASRSRLPAPASRPRRSPRRAASSAASRSASVRAASSAASFVESCGSSHRSFCCRRCLLFLTTLPHGLFDPLQGGVGTGGRVAASASSAYSAASQSSSESSASSSLELVRFRPPPPRARRRPRRENSSQGKSTSSASSSDSSKRSWSVLVMTMSTATHGRGRDVGSVFSCGQPGAGLIGLLGRAWVHDDLSVGSAKEFSPSPEAEEVGFEPTVGCPTHDFQSCRFGRSRTPPELQPAQANGSDRSRPADRAGRPNRPPDAACTRLHR